MRTKLILLFLVLGFFFLVSETYAQSVPASVKREIGMRLSCEPRNKDISAVKLGPGKSGYSGQCAGGGEAVLYEKSVRGITKIFQSDTQMNGSMSLSKRAYSGYYDVLIEGHGAAYFAVETHRWNGSRFVSVKCEWCDIDSNGNSRNCRPC